MTLVESSFLSNYQCEGFADFVNGKANDKALHKTCFPCHQPAKHRDFAFTCNAPQ
jgi:hypothetical protein